MDKRLSWKTKTPATFSTMLNKMAEHLESSEPPPDHWEEPKRSEFYEQMAARLTVKTAAMLGVLIHKWSMNNK